MELEKRLLMAAIKEAGGYSKISQQLGVTRQAVWEWCHKTNVPATRVIALSKVINMPPEHIRPDVFYE